MTRMFVAIFAALLAATPTRAADPLPAWEIETSPDPQWYCAVRWVGFTPDGTVHVGDRPNTTIAPQALHLMNNPHVRGAAHGFAKRVLGDGKVSDEYAVKRAYEMALCRKPSAEELADALPFIQGKSDEARQTAFADFCQVLFCLNEFLYAE